MTCQKMPWAKVSIPSIQEDLAKFRLLPTVNKKSLVKEVFGPDA